MTTPLTVPVVTPADREYRHLRSTYTTRHAPAEVLLPRNPGEVSEAITYAAATDLPISVRSGGHGLDGSSSNDGGIVIDLRSINTVEPLPTGSNLVRVGAGARWAEVARALAPHGLAITSGDHGNVGVGGLATAGGMGWLVRTYGLTIDHIRAATVVLPTCMWGAVRVRTDGFVAFRRRPSGDGSAWLPAAGGRRAGLKRVMSSSAVSDHLLGSTQERLHRIGFRCGGGGLEVGMPVVVTPIVLSA